MASRPSAGQPVELTDGIHQIAEAVSTHPRLNPARGLDVRPDAFSFVSPSDRKATAPCLGLSVAKGVTDEAEPVAVRLL